MAAPPAPSIDPAPSPARVDKIAVEALDHARGRRRNECGGRRRGARRQQQSGKPKRDCGFLHDRLSSLVRWVTALRYHAIGAKRVSVRGFAITFGWAAKSRRSGAPNAQ